MPIFFEISSKDRRRAYKPRWIPADGRIPRCYSHLLL